MKYTVKKEFVAKDGSKIFNPEDTYITTTNGGFTKMLLEHGFIEPVEYEEWQPKFGDEYYLARPVGTIGPVSRWQWDNDDQDHANLDLGLAFKTKSEAEKMVEWLKAVKVLRRDSERSMAGRKLRLMNDAYHVWFNLGHFQVMSLLNSNQRGSSIYNPFPFYRREDAAASIKEHRAEWVTFFGGFRDED